MHERRGFLAAAGVLAFSSLAGCANGRADRRAGSSDPAACQPFDKARQAALSPDQALDRLEEGNSRFLNGTRVNCDLMAQVKATASGQAPFATVVGCVDSRVPPELVFDQGIGDIFVARVAGNFVNTDIIGSLEFATQLVGSKLIVVLGHTDCGAVKGAVDDARSGNLTATLANIRPAVLKTKGIEGTQDSRNKKLVQAVAEQNARDAAAMLLARSDILRLLVTEGKLKVVAAMHDISTGKVSWMS
jgi:carbonic anhydrase